MGAIMVKGKKKAVAAGHICLDITPAFGTHRAEFGKELFRPGSLIETGAADIHIGGAVANTGLAMKFFGTDVALMGKIGADVFGTIVRNELKNWGAEENLLVSDTENTSYSVVLAPPGMDRIFLHHPGANAEFTAADPDYRIIGEADLFHFGYPPLMKKLYSNGGEELVQILRNVKRAGTAVSLDMAAIDENSEAAGVNWNEILKACLPYVDFFVPSAEELTFMMDRALFDRWKRMSAGSDLIEAADIKELGKFADRLIAYGAGAVLIKCGSRGMYFRTGSKERLKEAGSGSLLEDREEEWAEVRYFEKSFRPDRIVSGTGAGDTSIAAFLSALLEGSAWKDCVGLAAGAGALCVSAYDALSGLRPLKEIRKRIADGWEKNQ